MERRRGSRFAVPRQVGGHLSVMQDVVIEEIGEAEVTVITTTPVAQGEQMLLQIESAHGVHSTLAVQGVSRRPVLVQGQLRHRVSLRIVRGEQGDPA